MFFNRFLFFFDFQRNRVAFFKFLGYLVNLFNIFFRVLNWNDTYLKLRLGRVVFVLQEKLFSFDFLLLLKICWTNFAKSFNEILALIVLQGFLPEVGPVEFIGCLIIDCRKHPLENFIGFGLLILDFYFAQIFYAYLVSQLYALLANPHKLILQGLNCVSLLLLNVGVYLLGLVDGYFFIQFSDLGF